MRKFDCLETMKDRTRTGSQKQMLFLEEIDSIQELLDRGFGLLWSEIRDLINDKYDNIISKKGVKLFICAYFGDQVKFVISKRRNESMMLFLSKLIVQDVIAN